MAVNPKMGEPDWGMDAAPFPPVADCSILDDVDEDWGEQLDGRVLSVLCDGVDIDINDEY